MKLSSQDLINENLIRLDSLAKTKDESLKMISDIMLEEKRISSKKAYYQGMLEREKASTTGFGGGIAIPHAKIKEVIEPTISVIKLSTPVEWESLDNQPVELIIALAVPDSAEGTTHLQLLAKLSENLMEDDFVESLLNTNTKTGFNKLIKSIF